MRYFDINDFSRSEGARLPFSFDVDLSGYDPAFSCVTVEGTLRNTVGVMTLNAVIKGICTACCDRCLKPTELSLQAEIRTVITPDSSEDESVSVSDGKIDLERTAYDALVLALPAKILCREDCKGLCPVCGADRNEGSCNCKADK